LPGHLDWAPLLQGGLLTGVPDATPAESSDEGVEEGAADGEDTESVMDVCPSITSVLDEADGHAEKLKRGRDDYERDGITLNFVKDQIRALKRRLKEKKVELAVLEGKMETATKNVFDAADKVVGGLTHIRHLDGQN
jgi:hypothetical protein